MQSMEADDACSATNPYEDALISAKTVKFASRDLHGRLEATRSSRPWHAGASGDFREIGQGTGLTHLQACDDRRCHMLWSVNSDSEQRGPAHRSSRLPAISCMLSEASRTRPAAWGPSEKCTRRCSNSRRPTGRTRSWSCRTQRLRSAR